MRLGLGFAVAAALCPAAHAGTANYTTAEVPACTLESQQLHDFIRENQSGLDATDPDGHYIGASESDGEFWDHWVAIDRYKHVMCGKLFSYSYFTDSDWSWFGDERDGNFRTIPSGPFMNLISNAIDWGYVDSGDVLTCGWPNSKRCMNGEITWHPDYDDNPWFPTSNQYASPLEISQNQPICMYGPWVADNGHDGVPEIHPTETMWWPSVPTPTGLYKELHLAMFQDESDRYGYEYYYVSLPAGIKPWAAGPRTAKVRFPFKVAPSGTPADVLRIVGTWRKRLVSTDTNPALAADATDGTIHALAYNGVPRFRIIEQQPDAELGVVFNEDDIVSAYDPYDLCRRSDGSLQGYAILRSQFGRYSGPDESAADEGFQEVTLQHLSGRPTARISNNAPPNTLRTEVLGASLSTDPDGPIVSYLWNFGDGTISTAPQVTKTWTSYGIYNVGLTVTDADGNTSTASKQIKVLESGKSLHSGVSLRVGGRECKADYFIDLPFGARNLVVSTTLRQGIWRDTDEDGFPDEYLDDVEMLVRRGALPTDTAYDCRSQGPGASESCSFPIAAPGVWWVRLRPDAPCTSQVPTTRPDVNLIATFNVSTFRNDVDYTILGEGEIDYPVVVTTVPGNAPSTLRVRVAIEDRLGNTWLSLVAPDGSVYPVMDEVFLNGGDFEQTFTVDASAEPANGTWKLRVNGDSYDQDGYVDWVQLEF